MNDSSLSLHRMFAVLGILGLVLAFSTIVPASMAQQPAAPSSQQTATQPSTAADLPALPLSPIEKAKKDGTALPLSLKDVTKLALQNNLDIAIQDTQEAVSQQRIRQVYGDYDPKLTGTLGVSAQKSAITNYTNQSAVGYNKNENAQWNFTFNQTVKTGGSVRVQWNSQRTDNNSTFSTFTPQYNGSATVSFTQPLLKNFRIDSTRANIKLYSLDLKNTDSQFKQKVTDTISNIQTQYWSLVAAIRDYDIKRQSMELARISLRDNRRKVEVGTLAPIDVTDSEANVAQREVDLIASEETILSQENALRALISNNRNSDIWSQVIIPTDTPDFVEYKIDMGTAIDTALKNRPELEQSDISLRKDDINKSMLLNNRKWQLDLTGSLGSNGVAGPQSYKADAFTGQLLRDQYGNPIPNTPLALVGGLPTAYKTVFTEGYTNWQVQFQLTIPLRNRSMDAQIAQQDITKRQDLMNRRKTEQSIQADVRNAVQSLQTRRNQVQAASESTRLSDERLRGEEKRFAAGLSQNYLVLQRQNELAQAQYAQLQALINYKRAIITLQKSMYTLLESNDFEIAKGSSSKVPDLK
jgi:outer membrane protein TolC